MKVTFFLTRKCVHWSGIEPAPQKVPKSSISPLTAKLSCRTMIFGRNFNISAVQCSAHRSDYFLFSDFRFQKNCTDTALGIEPAPQGG
jgi:hypothetical protein